MSNRKLVKKSSTMTPTYVTLENPHRPVPVTDWTAVQSQGLRELLKPDTPIRFFYCLEFDPDLNKTKDARDCIKIAISFVDRVFALGGENPLFTHTAPCSHEARYNVFVRSTADLARMMDHLQFTLERDVTDHDLDALRVIRVIDGVKRQDWIFRFGQPMISIPVPPNQADLVHSPVPPGVALLQALDTWQRPTRQSAATLEGGPRAAVNANSVVIQEFVAAVLPTSSVFSVTPLYPKRPNKLMPCAIRLVLESAALSCNHRYQSSYLDVFESGTCMIQCSTCDKKLAVPLSFDDLRVFRFLDMFWGISHWMEALNATYTQLADGKIVERMINDEAEVVFLQRTTMEFNTYLKGHKYPVWAPKKQKGEEKFEWKLMEVANHWLASLNRSQCKAKTFNPALEPGLHGDFLNMFEGLGIEPKAPLSGNLDDAAPLFRQHLRKVICNNDPVATEYLEHCLAQLVRYPHIKLCIVFVLKAKQGAGKNTLLDVIRRIFGRHGVEVANARHVTGNFNQHLANKICIILNEAVWGGDKQTEGTLKASITEATTMFEPKGVDAHEGRNYWTFFISSNEKWCIPASPEVRRFFMLDVSDARIGDTAYFSMLHKAICDGEDREFLWYLQNRACSHPNQWKPAHNMPPRTRAIVDQMMQDRNQALLRFLLCQLKEEGEWIFPGISQTTPIIQKGRSTKIHGANVLEALRRAAEHDMPLRNQLSHQNALTAFLTEHLGPCFKPRERFLAHEQPPGSTNDKCYWFASAEEIKTHLSTNVLQVPNYFGDADDLPPEKRRCQ